MIIPTIAMDRITTDMTPETSIVTRFSREDSSVQKPDRRDDKTYNPHDHTPPVWDDPPERVAGGEEEAGDS